uniref:Uncharacterized protein n=1 Tax=Moniliophthora roreri TaxID=221103 RepID=A0A0W0GEN1_MONRR
MESGSQGDVSPSLISVFVESILYGVFIILSFVTIVILIHRRRLHLSASPGRKAHTGVLLVASSMFLVASIHIVASLYRILTPMAQSDDSPGDPVYSLRDTPYTIKIIAYFVQTMLGDGFWLYRLHVVWNGDKRVTYPFALLLASNAGCAFRF